MRDNSAFVRESHLSRLRTTTVDVAVDHESSIDSIFAEILEVMVRW